MAPDALRRAEPGAALEIAPLFFYGTLRDPDLLALVTGRDDLSGLEIRRAELIDARVGRVAGESFPMLFDAPGARAEGIVVADLAAEERARVAFFEDADYALRLAQASVDGASIAVAVFRPTERIRDSGRSWDLERWVRDDKALLMACAEEQLSYFGSVSQDIVETWWPDIKARAERRLGLTPPSIRSPFNRDDVEIVSEREPYSAFFRVTELEVRRRSFDTPASQAPLVGAPAARAGFRIGEVATVLPYDPRDDAVILIEQWRAGPWLAQETNPWIIETVAGRIDPGEAPEATARREAVEETGVTLGRIEAIGAFFASPGATDERMHMFVGEADLLSTGTDGVFGVAGEHEEIRAMKLSFWDAMTAMSRGDVGALPATLSLLWLARHRERLMAQWR